MAAIALRRLAYSARPHVNRYLSDKARRPRLHQPLGYVHPSTDLDAVRSKWGSDAMDKIQLAPPIEVDADFVICDGGGGPLGHPLEYIKLRVSDEDAGPQVCKYCGLRYIRKRKQYGVPNMCKS